MAALDVGVLAWGMLMLAALLVGVAKTAIGGIGSVAAVIFAAVLPAKVSTGTLLPLLICGDLVAVLVYHRHAHGPTVVRLLLGVLPGIVVGAWFLSIADDTLVRRTIAVAILALVGLQLASSRRTLAGRKAGSTKAHDHPVRDAAATGAAGVAAGFATMTANAAGPVTTIYLLRAGLPVMEMIGTGAWFYLVVNLAKLPFSARLGLITANGLLVDLVLLPAMLLGTLAGIRVARRIDRRQFEGVAVGVSALAAILLLLQP